MRVLILADRPGWIVERITDKMIDLMPFDFTKRYYTQITPQDFIDLANSHDLIHYQNSDVDRHLTAFVSIKKPIIISIRSHRYPGSVRKVLPFVKKVHVISPALREEFDNSVYIPDGIFEGFEPSEFVVGFAGEASNYKGYPIIEKACEDLGVKFKPATNLKPEDMRDYYKSINLLVSASENEGFCHPVMECLSLNIPVLTTNVGMARYFNVHTSERTLESIKKGIERFFTTNQVKAFTWEKTCKEMEELYKQCVS